MKTLLLFTPILVVLAAAVYFIWAFNRREERRLIAREINRSGSQGEHKVQRTLSCLQKPNSQYQVFHNIRLGPDADHTNEYDTVVIGPNGIFHIETKNYGGERGGTILVDSNDNWLLHKKSGYSKIITNPQGQVDSHEYRLQGFLNRVVGVRNLPTQGIIVLSCDRVTVRFNKKSTQTIPVLHRDKLVDYIKNYNQNGNLIIYPRTIKKICKSIEAMNKISQAN